MKVDKLSALERRHNQEHRICAIRPCLVKLDVIDHEFLIESRQRNGLFDSAKVIQTALKEILIGQHGKSRSACFLICFGDGDVIKSLLKFRPEQSQTGRSFLYFGD